MNKNVVPWRVTRTFPSNMAAGQKNVFYKQYHCQHSTRNLRVKNLLSKYVQCPAVMTITISIVDKHLPEYPTIIKIFNNHDHDICIADIVKYRDVSREIEEKFKQLFINGHSPYIALDIHKMDLQQ